MEQFQRDYTVRYRRLRALVEAALRPMFTEVVPTGMGDSGAAYGYQFQRNQKRHPADKPYSRMKGEVFRWKDRETGEPKERFELETSINCFRYLAEYLHFSPRMERKWRAFADAGINEKMHWMDLMREFADSRPGAAGIYGEGSPFVEYTYNRETMLDQDYQFCYWEEVVGEEPYVHWDHVKQVSIKVPGKMRQIRKSYVLLQIHGGCDARWGFTEPKLFEVQDDQEFQILFPSDGSLFSKEGGSWRTENGGYTWSWDGGYQNADRSIDTHKYLGDFPVMDPVALRKAKKTMKEVLGKGVVVVGRTGRVYCPLTGGVLQLS